MLKVSLARQSLVYDWLRYLPAILAVAFAGLLILVQIGLTLGQFGTVTVILDQELRSGQGDSIAVRVALAHAPGSRGCTGIAFWYG